MQYAVDTISTTTPTPVVHREVGVVIRRIRAEDLYTVLNLGKTMHDTSEFRHLPFEFDHVRGIAMNCVTRDDHFGMIAETNGAIIGMMGGYLTRFISCRVQFAQDLLVYITPDKRGTIAAVKLIRAFVDWAKKQNAKEVVCGVTAPPPEQRERVFQLYQRLGFEEAGRLFRMRF